MGHGFHGELLVITRGYIGHRPPAPASLRNSRPFEDLDDSLDLLHPPSGTVAGRWQGDPLQIDQWIGWGKSSPDTMDFPMKYGAFL